MRSLILGFTRSKIKQFTWQKQGIRIKVWQFHLLSQHKQFLKDKNRLIKSNKICKAWLPGRMINWLMSRNCLQEAILRDDERLHQRRRSRRRRRCGCRGRLLKFETSVVIEMSSEVNLVLANFGTLEKNSFSREVEPSDLQIAAIFPHKHSLLSWRDHPHTHANCPISLSSNTTCSVLPRACLPFFLLLLDSCKQCVSCYLQQPFLSIYSYLNSCPIWVNFPVQEWLTIWAADQPSLSINASKSEIALLKV